MEERGEAREQQMQPQSDAGCPSDRPGLAQSWASKLDKAEKTKVMAK